MLPTHRSISLFRRSLATLAVELLVMRLPGVEPIHVAVVHAESSGDQYRVMGFNIRCALSKIFGSTWSTSPDPSDFHFFSTIDLYAKNANFYRDSNGDTTPILRDHGQARATMQQLAGLESVLGDYGGQLGSFEWVFSPRGPDGRP